MFERLNLGILDYRGVGKGGLREEAIVGAYGQIILAWLALHPDVSIPVIKATMDPGKMPLGEIQGLYFQQCFSGAIQEKKTVWRWLV